MAIRPVFFPILPSEAAHPGVNVRNVSFPWVPGQAFSQRQKCAHSLQSAIRSLFPEARVLEISSKSSDLLGVELSALNLTLPDGISVENHYQCAKIFDSHLGPFPEWLCLTPQEVRRRIHEAGEGRRLRGFSYAGEMWPLMPVSLFYDWLYCTALVHHTTLTQRLLSYNAFTDIEFNPEKSVSCQAAAAAYYCSLHAFGVVEPLLKSPAEFEHAYSQHIRMTSGKAMGTAQQEELHFT